MQNLLRPTSFKNFIGQEKNKAILKVMIKSSKKQNKSLDHILFYGTPGMGKTSLANIIANEVDANIRYAQGALIEKKSDLLAIFGSLSKHEIVFIDEIHSINKNVEEMFYSIMEDGVIDITIGPEEDSKIIRMKIPSFTLIGATTKIAKLSTPFRDRFGALLKLSKYNQKDICKIVENSAKKLKMEMNYDVINEISKNSRHIPRIANNLIKRIKDYYVVENKKNVSMNLVKKVFKALGIHKNGVIDYQIDFLTALLEIFDEKYVSLENIANVLRENKSNIEQEIEPLLLELGYIEKSSRGRRITTSGVKYLLTYNLK